MRSSSVIIFSRVSERTRAISNLFLPPAASAVWVDLPERQRRLAAVRLMQTDHPGHEAQAIAILIRQTLEEPEKRVALVTPDRGLARRVAAEMLRWGVIVDDSAGRPLSETPACVFLRLTAHPFAQDIIELEQHEGCDEGEDDDLELNRHVQEEIPVANDGCAKHLVWRDYGLI